MEYILCAASLLFSLLPSRYLPYRKVQCFSSTSTWGYYVRVYKIKLIKRNMYTYNFLWKRYGNLVVNFTPNIVSVHAILLDVYSVNGVQIYRQANLVIYNKSASITHIAQV